MKIFSYHRFDFSSVFTFTFLPYWFIISSITIQTNLLIPLFTYRHLSLFNFRSDHFIP
jgi:hypothetical protein